MDVRMVFGGLLLGVGTYIAVYLDWGTIVDAGILRVGVETIVGGVVAAIGAIIAMSGLEE